MSPEDEGKSYNWKWVTADELLSTGPCEFIHAHLIVGAANNYAAFYDGENTTGTEIVKLQSAARTAAEFAPTKPVYCRRGLYVDLSDNVDGVFVQWREIRA